MNLNPLLPDTKFPEDHIEDILDIDPTKQLSQGLNRQPQILGSEFLTLPNHRYATLQRNRGLLQQLTLPLPADQASLPGAKIILRKPD
jgi:hypothetical protein